MPVRRRTGAAAFLQLVDRVWKYGAENPIDTGGEAVRELRNPVVVVEAENYDAIDVPDWLTAVPELGISRAALEGYARTQFQPDAYLKEIFPGVQRFERAAPGSYLYAELLYAFPRPAEVDGAVRLLHETAGYDAAVRYLRAHARVSEARVTEVVTQVGASDLAEGERLAVLLEAIIPPTNQVANIADRIRRKPDDLDKEAVLWDPRYHSLLESGRPCLMKLSFSVRAGKLDVLAFFRSHDVFGAWFYNYYGIATLLRGLAQETGVTPGRIVVESESAHLYPRHWPTIERLLKAEREDKPGRLYFDVEQDGDPRGNVIITLVDGKIDIKLLSPEGSGVIFELQAASAHELLYRLKHVDPFSRLDHAAFVGSELARAEVALRLGLPYVQERPLALPGAGSPQPGSSGGERDPLSDRGVGENEGARRRRAEQTLGPPSVYLAWSSDCGVSAAASAPSIQSLLASGPEGSVYLLCGRLPYGTAAGPDSWWKVIEQTCIIGYSATAMRPRLASSSVGLPDQPGWNTPAVP